MKLSDLQIERLRRIVGLFDSHEFISAALVESSLKIERMTINKLIQAGQKIGILSLYKPSKGNIPAIYALAHNWQELLYPEPEYSKNNIYENKDVIIPLIPKPIAHNVIARVVKERHSTPRKRENTKNFVSGSTLSSPYFY